MGIDKTMMNLAVLRENLDKMMQPEVLNAFADFLQATGNEDRSMLGRYKWFVENPDGEGADCRYARMAKEFFLHDQADKAAKAIVWLYKNWAKTYE